LHVLSLSSQTHGDGGRTSLARSRSPRRRSRRPPRHGGARLKTICSSRSPQFLHMVRAHRPIARRPPPVGLLDQVEAANDCRFVAGPKGNRWAPAARCASGPTSIRQLRPVCFAGSGLKSSAATESLGSRVTGPSLEDSRSRGKNHSGYKEYYAPRLRRFLNPLATSVGLPIIPIRPPFWRFACACSLPLAVTWA